MLKKTKVLFTYTLCFIFFVGCINRNSTGEKYSKEQLLKEAIKMEWKDISLEIAKNPVLAKDKYEGEKCILKGYIGEIFDADYIELNWYTGYWGDQNIESDYLLDATSALRMDLDDEDAKTVLKNDEVTVVGILSSIQVNGTELTNAYLIN